MVKWAPLSLAFDDPLALLDLLQRYLYLLVVMALILFMIWFQFLKARELYGDNESAKHEQLLNCPSCGARLSVELETCDHCGEPIDRSVE